MSVSSPIVSMGLAYLPITFTIKIKRMYVKLCKYTSPMYPIQALLSHVPREALALRYNSKDLRGFQQMLQYTPRFFTTVGPAAGGVSQGHFSSAKIVSNIYVRGLLDFWKTIQSHLKSKRYAKDQPGEVLGGNCCES